MKKIFGEAEEYNVKALYKKISVEEFLRDYIDIEKFLECCKQCDNYNSIWSCPPYDFDVIDYWKQYKYLHIIGFKVDFTKEYLSRSYDKNQLNKFIRELFNNQKEHFYKVTSMLEDKYEKSVSLGWGKCYICHRCTRKEFKKCRYEKDLRYSIESLGGNVNKLTKDLFNIDLKWAKEGKLPEYYFTSIGLLTKEDEDLNEVYFL